VGDDAGRRAPPHGGLVAGTLGTDVCFVVDAVLLLGAAALTAATRSPFSDPSAAARAPAGAQDVGRGVGYARRERRVLALITCKAGPAFGNGALSLFPLYGAAAFGWASSGIG
jgi:hypothetical protein